MVCTLVVLNCPLVPSGPVSEVGIATSYGLEDPAIESLWGRDIQLNIFYYTRLLKKLTVSQLFKKFPSYYKTRKFITAFTSVHHLSIPWAKSIQSIPPHPTSWTSLLILSSHLRLCLPSGLFPSGFSTKPCTRLSSLPYALHTPSISFFSIWSKE